MPAAGLLVLRLVLAVVLVGHGAHDIFGVFETPGIGHGGLSARAAHMASIGLSPGMAFAVLDGVAELLGGLLIAIGLVTRWAAVAVAVFKALLLWRGAWRWGFFLNWTIDPTRGHGIEFLFIVLGALACLFLAGAGDWSLDGIRYRSAATRAAGRARLRAK